MHRDVKVPVRRDATGELVGTKRATSRDVASFELKNGVDLVGAGGHVLGRPAENLSVEGLCRGLIGGGKFDPSKFAGGVFLDVGHDGESVLRGKRGGKREELRSRVRGSSERFGVSSVQAVGAGAEEFEEVEVAEDLELLADFVGDVGVFGMELA